jgi:hypothetical protein
MVNFVELKTKVRHTLISPLDLNITNPRIILLENIRQTCIYNLSDWKKCSLTPPECKERSLKYWDYMIQFSDTCSDLANPLFTEKCANMVIDYLSLDRSAIDNCIAEEINTRGGKVRSDYQEYHNNKVYKIPEIMINDTKYKGSWYSKFILDAICTGFVIFNEEEREVCNKKAIQSSGSKGNGVSIGTIIIICVIITICMVIVLYCYKRVVNRSLEQTLNEKIQQQTIFSLGQYQVFKDDNRGIVIT